MEYSSTVWDPHTARNIDKLEMVKRPSARFFHSDYRITSSPTEMMKALAWESLVERRWQAKAIMMYKICNNLIDMPVSLFTSVGYYGNHSQACFIVPYCRTDHFNNLFIPSGTKSWNGLPMKDRSIGSLDAFKIKLRKAN